MMRFASIKQMEIKGGKLEYFGIDNTLVWQIIKNDIPNLKIKIIEVLKIVA